MEADELTPENPPARNKKKNKTGRLIFFAIIIGLGVNVLISAFMNQEQLLHAVGNVRIWHLIVPFLCYLGVNLIDGLRLVLVLRQCGYRLNYWEAFYNSVLGMFISNLTPSAAGGQPFQIHQLQKLEVPGKVATNIILSRFVVNAMILMALIVLAIPTVVSIAGRFQAGDIVMYLGLGSTFLFSLLFLLVLVKPQLIHGLAGLVDKTALGRLIGRLSKTPDWLDKLKAWVAELRMEIRFLWTQKLVVMLGDVLLNVLAIMLQGLSVYYVLLMITGVDLSYFQVLIVFVVIWQVVFYIPTPGASGSLEGAFAAAYAGLTGKPELTLVAIIVWRLGSYYVHVFSGLTLVSLYGRIKKFPVRKSSGTRLPSPASKGQD